MDNSKKDDFVSISGGIPEGMILPKGKLTVGMSDKVEINQLTENKGGTMGSDNVVLHKTADPVKVKLIKGQKESYGWEISIQGNTIGNILAEVGQIDEQLRKSYLSSPTES